MSRTNHRKHVKPTGTKPTVQLTKGPRAGGYSKSTFDAPSNKGKPSAWTTWLHDYCGYAKQRKRRRNRKILKVYGRRVERRRRNEETL